MVNYYLHKACGLGDVSDVEALLAIGASVDSTDEMWLDTPLHEACGNGQVQAVSLLLSKGASAVARTKEGWLPLHMAASRGAADIMRLLLGVQGVRDQVNAKAAAGHTALDIACTYGYDSPHEAGRLLRDSGGRTVEVENDWIARFEKEEEKMEAQRERILEESKGKQWKVTGTFRPVGFGLTQALCTRDTRDPNRNGHKKRSMMDSMDLLKFRRMQYDRAVPEKDLIVGNAMAQHMLEDADPDDEYDMGA